MPLLKCLCVTLKKKSPLSTSASGAPAPFQAPALNVNKDRSKGLQQGSLVTASLQRWIQFNKRFPQLWKHLLPGYRVSSWPATLVWFILNFQNFCPSGLALCTALQRCKHSGVLFCLDLFKSTLSLHHFIWASRFAAQLYICCDWWRWPFRKVCLKYPSSLHTVSEVAGGCLKCLGPFPLALLWKAAAQFQNQNNAP